MMSEGAMIGTRTSIYADPEFVKAHKMPKTGSTRWPRR